MAELTITEARADLSALLDRVARGEEIVITRHGQPAAILLHPDAARSRRAGTTLARAEGLASAIEASRRRALAPAAVSTEHADEWVAAVVRDRR